MTKAKAVNSKSLRKELLARRAELQRVDDTSRDARRPVELDQSRVGRLSRMDALQAQAMALETERRRGIELHRIDLALGRMADGDYGYCTACGEEIGARRLLADPTSPLCIDCAETAPRMN